MQSNRKMDTNNEDGTLMSVSLETEINYRLRTFQSMLNLLTHILIGIVVGASLLYALRNGLPIGATPIHVILCVLGSTLNLLTHILIGIVVGAALTFAFRNGLPVGATPKHITLCVLGYQLLMAQAILSLSPNNGWSAHLKLVDKRRAHWILQILGSGLAITGTFIKILDKDVHWNSLHGQFALVALVFTTVSLVNGLTSLWSYEIQRVIRMPPKLSKLPHVCFGVVGFSAACICLCYGFDKAAIRGWVGDSLAVTLITFTACLNFIIILDPLINFGKKIMNR